MATIDNLTLQINADTKEAERKIHNLASALSALSNAKVTEAKLNKVANGIASVATSINEIREDQISKVERLAEALTKIGNVNVTNLAKAMKNINKINEAVKKASQSQDMKLPAILDDTFKAPDIIKHLPAIQKASTALGEYNGLQEEFRQSAENLKRIGHIPIMEEGREFFGSFREISEPLLLGMNKSPLINADEVLSKMKMRDATNDLANFRKQWAFWSTAGRYTQSFFRTVMPDFTKFRSLLKSMIAPITGFIKSIGRIALYRAIRSLIKGISAGIKEGVQNLAMFSMLVEEMDTHKANRVMSLYTSNFLYLKNAIATAVIPVFKALEPVIDAVIKKTIEFINVLAQLTSMFSGSTTYTKAKYYYVDYAKSLDKASGSASKLNKQLAKFDELNNLTTHEGSGSGNDLDYLKMFEDPVPIEDWILNLKNANWETVASTLTERIRGVLDNIDWESIKGKVGEFARNLAGLFNGIFTHENFKSVSKALAEAINTSFTFLFNLGNDLNAYQAGYGMSAGLAEFFGTLDTSLIADTIDVWVGNFKVALKGAIDGITDADWKKIFNNLWNFFEHLDFDTVAITIGVVSVITITKVAKWVFGSGVLAFLGSSLAQYIISKGGISLAFPSLSAFIGKISFGLTGGSALAGIGAQIGALIVSAVSGYLIGNGIGQIFASLTNDPAMLESLQNANPFTNGKLGELMYKWFELWVEAQGKTLLTRISRLIIEGIIKGATSFSEFSIKKGLLPFFMNFFAGLCAVFGIASPAKEMYPVGKNIVLGIIEGIKQINFFSSIEEWFNTSVKPWFSDSKWGQLGEGIKSKLSSTLSYSNMWNIGDKMGKGLYDAFKSMLDSILTAYKQLKSNIENNPIVQQIVTISSGSAPANTWVESKDISNQTVIPAGVKNAKTPTVTSTAKSWHGLPSKPSGMPTSDWNTYLENWKKNHPQNYYAHGGFPNVGSLFVAGEAGAELVGNFNGRTGVANTDQIEEAMYQATYDAMSKALSENGMNVTIEGDVDNMFRVMQRKSSDFYTRTGRPAF